MAATPKSVAEAGNWRTHVLTAALPPTSIPAGHGSRAGGAAAILSSQTPEGLPPLASDFPTLISLSKGERAIPNQLQRQ
jgi:hypothetical protein